MLPPKAVRLIGSSFLELILLDLVWTTEITDDQVEDSDHGIGTSCPMVSTKLLERIQWNGSSDDESCTGCSLSSYGAWGIIIRSDQQSLEHASAINQQRRTRWFMCYARCSLSNRGDWDAATKSKQQSSERASVINRHRRTWRFMWRTPWWEKAQR